ncbi:aldo/keto reductase [Synoicihabitans lomoniglobus]|uniref:Aldo/keto reductase n=1 Tax=Synoicihabitans lomoniglobus TaxID=2909285 RepID=A0AAF0CSI5_9BACT|nr:aldo/keto reductase [Opitutaceae bacterium LMO-M01]WED67252.1 aldo/keto reductase [Opitutaceae bacterium LMO-M01]
MEYRKLGRTNLSVAELCLGSMQFGWTANEDASFAVMDAYVAAGGNFIDTADVYTWWGEKGTAGLGESEEIIGRWLQARGGRDSMVIATKLGGPMHDGPDDKGLSRERVIKCCEASLRRLQVDHIDLYQCHWTDLSTPIEETLAAMGELVKAGKVRHVGASNYPAWRLAEALWQADKLGLPRFETYQPQYSLMETGLFELEPMALCKHHELGVIPYSPLACGFLTGKYRRDGAAPSARSHEVVKNYAHERGYAIIDALEEIGAGHGKSIAATAIAWLLSNPVVTSPIIGANSVAQLDTLLEAVGYRLSAEEMSRLNSMTTCYRNHRLIWD